MTQENKEFLLKDICSRLPYRIKCKVDLQGLLDICDEYKKRFEKAKIVIPDLFNRIDKPYCLWSISGDRVNFLGFDGVDDYNIPIELVRPYLFSLSSMTENQKEDLLLTIIGKEGLELFSVTKDGIISNDKAEQSFEKFSLHSINFSNKNIEAYIDWLNKNHFDYIGLIEKGLAIDCTNLNIY